jgi:hypothetical protein
VQRDSDEDAWRAIVENYGERVELSDDPAVDAEPGHQPDDQPGDPRGTESNSSGLQRLFRPLPEPQPTSRELDEDDEDDFVPPDPPPLPRLPPDRFLAWSGLFGSPSILLACLVLDFHIVPWLGYLLVASFIAGFVYLVVNMPHGEDVDPWDDGARL